jgi:hypothetical protein
MAMEVIDYYDDELTGNEFRSFLRRGSQACDFALEDLCPF